MNLRVDGMPAGQGPAGAEIHWCRNEGGEFRFSFGEITFKEDVREKKEIPICKSKSKSVMALSKECQMKEAI